MAARVLLPQRSSLRTSIIAAVVTVLLLLFLSLGAGTNPSALLNGGIFALIGAAATFTILRTGRVNGVRLALFIVSTALFTVAFSLDHEINRGSILLSQTQIDNADVPICPITIPFVLPPLLLLNKMVFPTSIAAVSGIVSMWLAMVLLFGRGGCAWPCEGYLLLQ
jgi:ferredoxin-type protein NapH